MISYWWPLVLVIVSNVLYQICAKSVPKDVHPFASLTVTYLVGAVAAGILYFFFAPGETGWICAYKAGWPVSVGFIVQSAFLAVVLLLIGYVLYHEPLSWSKIVGVVICLIGLVFLNR